MTVTSLVMQNRRGHASAKRTLRLPIIAPKEEVHEGKPDKSTIAPPRIRLPPRSRTGCWYVPLPAYNPPATRDSGLYTKHSMLILLLLVQDVSGEFLHSSSHHLALNHFN